MAARKKKAAARKHEDTSAPPFAVKDWPASRVVMRRLEQIKPYDKNPRTHPPEQIKLLARSMAESGVTMPILVDEAGVIIAGHGRLLAAKENGFEEYPVVVARGWNETQKRAERVRDNQIGLMSGWDDGMLRLEVGALKLDGYELPLLGFASAELDGFLNDTPPEAEIVPEPPKNPVVRKGDLWLLGKHRLLCGDATRADDVERLFDGTVPHLMVTDPPYGVNYDPAWRNIEAAKGNLAYADRRVGKVANDDIADWRAAWALFPGDVLYSWHPAGATSIKHFDAITASGFIVRTQIIWAKSNFPISRGDYHGRHEPCWYAVRKGKTGHWQGARDQTTLWQINLDKNVEGGHSTQKPIECMKRPIENNSARGDAVYDPFVGSGTTLIAAEMTERRCYAIEIEPAYCEVVINRWQTFTGKLATLDGKTLEQVAKERSRAKSKRKSAPLGAARAGNGLSAGGVAAAAKP